ncbi:retrotransposable element [Pimephales promelas]|nr:retrotransposable element [Pimephales promelas]
MAEFGLPPPAHFLAVPGDPPVPWANWLESFTVYLDALGFDDITDKRKMALLRHCLGVEGQRIFRNLGTPNDYDAAVTLLTTHFTGHQRTLLRRYKLRKRLQRPGESVRSYVTNLKDMARLCDYGVLQDQILRDQFIEGTSCEKTREKLLLEADDLTLSRAVDIALQIETAMECTSQLAGARPLADGATEQLQPAYHTSMHSANDSRGSEQGFPVQFTQRQNNRRTAQVCGNCGFKSHNSKAEHCPAKGQQCRNCLKQNHFAKMCRSAPATLPQHTGPPPAQHSYTEIRNVTAGQVAFKTCTVQLAEVTLPLLMDTGAAASLLNSSTYFKFFSHLPLDHPATALCGYDSSRIDILGVLHVPVHYGSKHLPSFPFHIARRGANLLGLDLFTGLGFTLRDDAGSDIHHITSTWQQRWPALFDGLGCLSAFTHRPLVNPENNLTLNPEKCCFAAPAIDFVGFRLSAKGISPLQSNIDAIHRIPEPTSASQVASFLGMTAYYLRFLPHYSQTTAPLRQLLKKEEQWHWTTACSEAVQTLKAQLTTPPVLAHFNPECLTLVTCDASDRAVGAVLSQVQDGVERPVAFASRALTPTEQRYSVGEREALACVWASERWHLYLYGRRFTLRTDHQALTTLLTASGSGHKPLRLHRWGERLRQYDYVLKFTPGRLNVVADLLSRSIDAPTPTVAPDEDTENELIHMLHTPLQSAVSLEELRHESECDPTLSSLRTYIRSGWPARVCDELMPFKRVRDELSCWGDVCVSRGLCTVVPGSLRARVLSMAHEGHLGIVKLKQRCRDLIWWPGIDRDIEALVKDCVPCLLSGKSGPPVPTPLQPVPWPSRPWEHLQLDICGEIHGRGIPHHQRFLVVLYDLHSKWPEVVPAGTITTQVITDILEVLFARWGMPRAITTDNGPQFISADFSQFLSDRGIKHIRTAYYNPQANGGVERFNQSLKNGVRAHLAQGCTFRTALNQTLMHYRASQHTTTGASPALLMLGREMELPLDRLKAHGMAAPTAGSSQAQTKAAVNRHQQRMRQYFDRKHRVKATAITAGDWVRARRPHRSNKMASYWSQPCQVHRQLGPATFMLSDGSRWHAKRLRKVRNPDEEMVAPLPSAPSPPVPICTGPQQASHTPLAAPSPAP